MNYTQDSGYINVTGYLKSGSNDFTFTVYNYCCGYTWGFEILTNNDTVFFDKAGIAGISGANNGDMSKPYQYVYNKMVTINVTMYS